MYFCFYHCPYKWAEVTVGGSRGNRGIGDLVPIRGERGVSA